MLPGAMSDSSSMIVTISAVENVWPDRFLNTLTNRSWFVILDSTDPQNYTENGVTAMALFPDLLCPIQILPIVSSAKTSTAREVRN